MHFGAFEWGDRPTSAGRMEVLALLTRIISMAEWGRASIAGAGMVWSFGSASSRCCHGCPRCPRSCNTLAARCMWRRGHLIFALNVDTGDWIFKLATLGSVVKVFPIACNCMASLIRGNDYALGFLDLKIGSLQLANLKRGLPKSSIAWEESDAWKVTRRYCHMIGYVVPIAPISHTSRCF